MGYFLTRHLQRELDTTYKRALGDRDLRSMRRVLKVDTDLTYGALCLAMVNRDDTREYEMRDRLHVLELRGLLCEGIDHAQREKAQGGLQ